jgi:hypothetical protein
MRLIVGESAWSLLAGVAAGIAMAVRLARYAKTLLFGTAGAERRDLRSFRCGADECRGLAGFCLRGGQRKWIRWWSRINNPACAWMSWQTGNQPATAR